MKQLWLVALVFVSQVKAMDAESTLLLDYQPQMKLHVEALIHLATQCVVNCIGNDAAFKKYGPQANDLFSNLKSLLGQGYFLPCQLCNAQTLAFQLKAAIINEVPDAQWLWSPGDRFFDSTTYGADPHELSGIIRIVIYFLNREKFRHFLTL